MTFGCVLRDGRGDCAPVYKMKAREVCILFSEALYDWWKSCLCAIPQCTVDVQEDNLEFLKKRIRSYRMQYGERWQLFMFFRTRKAKAAVVRKGEIEICNTPFLLVDPPKVRKSVDSNRVTSVVYMLRWTLNILTVQQQALLHKISSCLSSISSPSIEQCSVDCSVCDLCGSHASLCSPEITPWGILYATPGFVNYIMEQVLNRFIHFCVLLGHLGVQKTEIFRRVLKVHFNIKLTP